MRTALLILFAIVSIESTCQISTCHTDTDVYPSTTEIHSFKSLADDTIFIHIYTSYDLYVHLGLSPSGITQYIQELVGQVNSIYNLHHITIELADLTIWTEPDPYDLTDLTSGLTSFSSIHHQSHSGDLAHLITSDDRFVGGKAFFRGLCDDNKSFGISTVHGVLSNLWEYSWDTHILAHEIGHNLGSQHTHDCVWGPNNDEAIDGCSNNNGCDSAPIPEDGGTIMSYCQGHPEGIDFRLGLGEQPGSRIKNYIACLLYTSPSPRDLSTSRMPSSA